MKHRFSQKMQELVLLQLILLIGSFFLFTQASTSNQQAVKIAHAEEANGGEAPTNCRYGAVYTQPEDFDFFDTLNIGWTLNFRASYHSSMPDNVDFAHIIRLKQPFDKNGNRLDEYILTQQQMSDESGQLGPLIANNLGGLWLVGNEVDREYVQDDLEPAIYARAYHDVYHFIKERDPSAQVAISGLVQVTPGRIQYLDLVWQAYQDQYQTTMPVDVWNMHIYILPEIQSDGVPSLGGVAVGTDPSLAILHSNLMADQCQRTDVYCYAEHDDIDIFIEHARRMRQWMKSKGEQNKPLILTEFSTLFISTYENGDPFLDEFQQQFSPSRVINFMYETFDYMDTVTDTSLGYPEDNYRLVQQWMWFAMNEGYAGSSNQLVDIDRQGLTPMGEAFRNYTNNIAFVNNLYAKDSMAYLATPDTLTATLQIKLGNNGNSRLATPIDVVFYADEPRTQEIGRVTIPAGLGGCTMDSTYAEVEWVLPEDGVYHYWYTIDDGNAQSETNETDNFGTGFIVIGGENIYLPVIRR